MSAVTLGEQFAYFRCQELLRRICQTFGWMDGIGLTDWQLASSDVRWVRS